MVEGDRHLTRETIADGDNYSEDESMGYEMV